MKNQLSIRKSADESSLDRLKGWTYGVAIGSCLLALSFLCVSCWFGASDLISLLIMAIMFVLPTGLYSWINFKSAQAIARRREVHLSYFVAGVNLMMYFPFGILLSWYTWKVLSRPGVQELYQQNDTGTLLSQIPLTANPAITAQTFEHVPWHEAIASADDAEEAMWKEIEGRAAEQGATEESSDGPVRLVSGD